MREILFRSFNEFTEQYEIIEQNGNIYTVKERTK